MPKEDPFSEKTDKDAASQEMNKMFMEHQTDHLQEAFSADRAIKYILAKVDAGKLRIDMPLGEALEKRAEIIKENIGEGDEENYKKDNEEA